MTKLREDAERWRFMKLLLTTPPDRTIIGVIAAMQSACEGKELDDAQVDRATDIGRDLYARLRIAESRTRNKKGAGA